MIELTEAGGGKIYLNKDAKIFCILEELFEKNPLTCIKFENGEYYYVKKSAKEVHDMFFNSMGD